MNVNPDDDSKPFVVRWNALVKILLVESSVKGVARALIADYADFKDGSGCYPGNDRLAIETGYSERTVRFAWSVLRGLGMAERVAFGVPYARKSDDYTLRLPGNWKGAAVLGPHSKKFRCTYCHESFIPQGNCTVNSHPADKRGADVVRFKLPRMVFCPEPRQVKGRDAPSCFSEWDQAQRKAGGVTWDRLGQDCWKLFREARNDDW